MKSLEEILYDKIFSEELEKKVKSNIFEYSILYNIRIQLFPWSGNKVVIRAAVLLDYLIYHTDKKLQDSLNNLYKVYKMLEDGDFDAATRFLDIVDSVLFDMLDLYLCEGIEYEDFIKLLSDLSVDLKVIVKKYLSKQNKYIGAFTFYKMISHIRDLYIDFYLVEDINKTLYNLFRFIIKYLCAKDLVSCYKFVTKVWILEYENENYSHASRIVFQNFFHMALGNSGRSREQKFKSKR